MLTKTIKRTEGIICPEKITDLLSVFTSLQSLFVTKRNRWGPLNQPICCHPLCISSNENNLFELEAKGGYIAFYNKKGGSEKVSLEGKTVAIVLEKFFKAIKRFDYCTIHSVENEVGNTNQTKRGFDIQYKKGRIYLIDQGSENFSGSGADGDL
jgi:hypothetical protein